MPQQAQLAREIDHANPASGQVLLWPLGQMGFGLKAARAILYIDAYLAPRDKRRIPPPLRPQDITHADAFLGTHNHSDHIDKASWPALAAASPKARFIVPRRFADTLAAELGISAGRFIGLDDSLSCQVAGVKIAAIPSAHERLDVDAQGRNAFVGYVIAADGVTVYHAGDTCIYEGLQERLRRHKPDVMILPINGRDAERLARGCIGNMTYQEAADLAGELNPKLVIPGHWDLFADNPGDPAAFAAYVKVKWPAVAFEIPQPGQVIRFPA